MATQRPLLTVPHDLERDPNSHYAPITTSKEHALISAVDTDAVLYLRVNMPGVTRDEVEFRFESPSKLFVGARRAPDPDFHEDALLYKYWFDVPAKFFHTDGRVEHAMKHGMLVLSIPKKVKGSEVDSYNGYSFTVKDAAKSLPAGTARPCLAVFAEDFSSTSCYESEENVYLRVLMPGLGREDVEVRREPN